MLRSATIAIACITSVIAFSGCTNSCTNRHGCAYQRNEPTHAQRSGVHAASIERRLPILERRAGARIEGFVVNRWGEIWTKLDGGRYVAISHDGTNIHQSDTVDEIVSTDDPFPVHDVDPRAVDRIMRRLDTLEHGHPFIKASLIRDDFLYGGLRWEVMVGGGKYYATYAAAPDGSSVCRMVVSDHGRSNTPHRCPDFGHQPPGVPSS